MKKSILLVVMCLLSISLMGQHKIEKSKKELTAAEGNNRSSSSSRNSNSSSSNSNSGILEPILGFFFKITFKAVFLGAVGDYMREDHLNYSLSSYPYCKGEEGNYLNFEADTLSRHPMRFDVQNNFLYNDSQLYGNHLKLKIRPFQYFYLQSDYHQLLEIDPIDHSRGNLALFQFNFGYDRLRFEKFNLGWTLGATYVGSEVQKTGLSAGINAEWFMSHHLSFNGSVKWSGINGQPVNFYELQGKFHRKNYFFTAGFEHLKIGSPNYDFIALGMGIYL